MKLESEDFQLKRSMPEAHGTSMSVIWRLQTVVCKECTITTAFLVVQSSGLMRKWSMASSENPSRRSSSQFPDNDCPG